MTTTHKDNSKVYFRIGIGVIAIVYTLFSYLTPYQWDDLRFLGMYLDYNGGDYSFNFSAFIDTCVDVRLTDNGRLANILDILIVTFVPKWVFSICTGLVTAGMYWFLTKLVMIVTNRMHGFSDFMVLTAIWSISMVAFPWRDSIMIPDFSLNYLYSTFFSLWIIYVANGCENNRRSNALKTAGLCIVALIAGMFHEGFSAPVLGGLGVYALLKRFHLPLSWWIIVCAYALGTIFVLSSPGILGRVDNEIGGIQIQHHDWIYKTFLILPLPFLSAVVMAVMLSLPKLRGRLIGLFEHQIYVLASAGLILSAAMCYVLNALPRYGWFPSVLSVVVLLPPVLALMPRRFSIAKSVRIFSYILFVGVSVLMCNVLRWQYFFCQQDKEIHALIDQSADGTVYYDVFPPEHLPKVALYQPVRHTWVYSLQMGDVRHVGRSGKLIAVVPTALQDLRLHEIAMPGNHDTDIFLYKNLILGKYDKAHPVLAHRKMMQLKTDAGNEYNVKVRCGFPFVSVEGDTLMYFRHPLVDLQEKIVEAHWVE